MNPQNFLRINKVIFFALLGGMIMFLAIVIFLSEEIKFSVPEDIIFLVISITALGAAIFLGNFLFTKLIAPAKDSKSLTQKTTMFNTSSMVRYALTEAAVLINVVFFLVEENAIFGLIALAGILYFISLKPTNEKIISALDLSYEEKSDLGMK
ncbi:MAG: putative MFS family arabinose efflux permease [Arenicella sp.]|jgi:predicted MFS family arabinose efflux permease